MIIEVNLPNDKIPRVKEAFKARLIEGEAEDMENPTNEELLAKLQSYLFNQMRKVVVLHEKKKNDEEFVFDELE